jgi:flagellar biosynthesis anti-sigma factor FlgM
MSSINSINAQNISRTYVQNADATQGTSATRTQRGGHHHKAEQNQPQSDSVSLSDNAKALSAARQAVQDSPDVRDQKVSEIKQRVQDGTYNVSSSVLARKMLNQQGQQ